MASNFDIRCQILMWGVKLRQKDHSKPYLRNPDYFFSSYAVISHIPIDHMITMGFFMTPKWVKSALKGIIQNYHV